MSFSAEVEETFFATLNAALDKQLRDLRLGLTGDPVEAVKPCSSAARTKCGFFASMASTVARSPIVTAS